MTEEDENVLKSRISKDEHLDTQALHIFYTNMEVSEHNARMLNTVEAPLVTIKAKNNGPKNYRPEVSKDGRIANTQFLQSLNIKVGARCALTWNLSTIDGLVNGASGTIVGIEMNKMSIDKRVEAIIVSFDDEATGRSQREKHPRLTKKYEAVKGTPIFRMTHEFNITSRKGFQQAATANLEQFPIRINYASTAHKIQGQTVRVGCKVVIHWHKEMHRQKGMCYVMLGRTQVLDDIYILGEVDFKSIQCSKAALEESRRLFGIFVTEEQKKCEYLSSHWKISYLNVRSLKGHRNDVFKDNHLMDSDILSFGETWLEPGETVDIGDYNAIYVNAGRGKGVATYLSMMTASEPLRLSSSSFSAILVSNEYFDIMSVYISQGQNHNRLCEEMEDFIKVDKPMAVMGDMNMKIDANNPFQKLLLKRGFHQLLSEPTFDNGSLIDHIYVNQKLLSLGCTVNKKSVYYSDHDAISILIKKQQN